MSPNVTGQFKQAFDYANAARYEFKHAFDIFLSLGTYQGGFHENSGDGNRFGNRVLNHTHFRQSGVCLRRPRLN